MPGEVFPETDQREPAAYYVETVRGFTLVTAMQASTRAESTVELMGDPFGREDVVFTDELAGHLSRHLDGSVAGSQFDPVLFPHAWSVISFLRQAMPGSMRFDRYGMAGLTFRVAWPESTVLGYTGVMAIDELIEAGASIERGMRMPGGEEAREDGLSGAWYSEGANPHGRFEPKTWIATLTNPEAAATSEVSLIMKRDARGRPVVLTAHPGKIAPPLTVKTATENSLHDWELARYWNEHAFVKFDHGPKATLLSQHHRSELARRALEVA